MSLIDDVRITITAGAENPIMSGDLLYLGGLLNDADTALDSTNMPDVPTEGAPQIILDAPSISPLNLIAEMRRISEEFPNWLFEVEQRGVSHDDLRMTYVMDGQSYEVEGEIVYPRFDPSKLAEDQTLGALKVSQQ